MSLKNIWSQGHTPFLTASCLVIGTIFVNWTAWLSGYHVNSELLIYSYQGAIVIMAINFIAILASLFPGFYSGRVTWKTRATTSMVFLAMAVGGCYWCDIKTQALYGFRARVVSKADLEELRTWATQMLFKYSGSLDQHTWIADSDVPESARSLMGAGDRGIFAILRSREAGEGQDVRCVVIINDYFVVEIDPSPSSANHLLSERKWQIMIEPGIFFSVRPKGCTKVWWRP